MQQLQQANVGQGENILTSAQAADYSPLKYQMDLGSKLMEQGFQQASETNRTAMNNAQRSAEQATTERNTINAEKRLMMNQHKTNLGTLSQLISEYDDIIDNADMEDPIAQQTIPALMRKREQLAGLMAVNGKSPQYLSGVLKYGIGTDRYTRPLLDPTVQAETADYTNTNKKEEEKKSEEKKKEEQKKVEETSASSNVIHL